MKIVRTNANHPDFQYLVHQLDELLAEINGEDHTFYHQFNSLESIQQVVVMYKEDIPVACGAYKPFDTNSCEIKRMFTLPGYRGQGFAGKILWELESLIREMGYEYAVLETSVKLKSAIQLYKKMGYAEFEKYGQYKDAKDSICFRKKLNNLSYSKTDATHSLF